MYTYNDNCVHKNRFCLWCKFSGPSHTADNVFLNNFGIGAERKKNKKKKTAAATERNRDRKHRTESIIQVTKPRLHDCIGAPAHSHTRRTDAKII